MPTWTIEYPLLLQGDHARFYEDISLLRSNPEVISCNYSEREDRPTMMVTVSLMGAGPNNPRIQQIINRGTLQVPNVWLPLQVSRLIPGADGRYAVDRTEPRGRLQHGAIFDDEAHFEGRGPEGQPMLHNGMRVQVDPATGLLVPSADNPIGMITGVDLARPGTDLTVRGTFDNPYTADPRAAEYRRELEGQFTQEVRDPPPDSAYEHVGLAVFNPRALRQLRMYSGDTPPPPEVEDSYTEYFSRQPVRESGFDRIPDPLGIPQAPRRVAFPTFELQSSPQINLTDISTRRFNMLEHSRAVAVNQIQEEVDHQIFETMEAQQGVTSMGTPFTNRPIQGFTPPPPTVPETFLRRTRFEKILEDDDYLL
jgi:hypothetical protein